MNSCWLRIDEKFEKHRLGTCACGEHTKKADKRLAMDSRSFTENRGKRIETEAIELIPNGRKYEKWARKRVVGLLKGVQQLNPEEVSE